MAQAGPEKAVRPCWDRVQPSYGDFLNSFAMKALYKSRLFGQNERRKWTFRIFLPEQKKKKGKARWSWRADLAALGPYAMTSGQIFSRPARPNSVNKYIELYTFFQDVLESPFNSTHEPSLGYR